MSVVDGDWNDLKKYNLFEIYNLSKDTQPGGTGEGEGKTEKTGMEAGTETGTGTDTKAKVEATEKAGKAEKEQN